MMIEPNLQPLLALVADVPTLVVARLLNHIMAVYLIAISTLGLLY